VTAASALAEPKTAAAQPADGPVLAVKNIEVIYDHVILALRGVSLLSWAETALAKVRR
jgi:branched-chain amino acid transport system ATP-binding protein